MYGNRYPSLKHSILIVSSTATETPKILEKALIRKHVSDWCESSPSSGSISRE